MSALHSHMRRSSAHAAFPVCSFTYPMQIVPVVQVLERAMLRRLLAASKQRALATTDATGKSAASSVPTEGQGARELRRRWAARRAYACAQNMMRMSSVAATCGVAIAVPQFGLVASLVGALGSSMLAFILPMAIWIKLSRTEDRRPGRRPSVASELIGDDAPTARRYLLVRLRVCTDARRGS